MSRQLLHRGLAETGLLALSRCHPDIKLLCLQRFVRMFAYGATTLQLVAYFELLGFTATRIGLFMAFTLVGDVCISLVLTSIADGVGRKAVLAAGAALMAVSGVVFATCSGFRVLLAASVVGVISPSGAEIGPFRAVEESIVAHLTTAEDRSDVYAWYSLMGAAGTAFGAMTSGWTAHYLTATAGWELEAAYRVVFYGYAALGVFKFFLALLLGRDIEAERDEGGVSEEETAPILGERSVEREVEAKTWRSKLVPKIARESMPVVVTLCFFFALDSFASSLTTQSWIAFFFRWKFNVDDGTLGSLFFTTSLLAAATTLAMVFTHLPSTIFTALVPLPRDANTAIVFLILRALTHSMDVAARAAFLAGLILPKERTTVLGLINVLKTCVSSVGPVGVGILVYRNLFWVAFVGAGCLKVVYDLGMLVSFRKHEREQRDGEAGGA
ncbi:major facilitator superfamily domain-containing protein [Colletotrichum phormii]|uniref:Major facilitator superfamily domain-containing protein n=1 Tax=Colletotrichum phormii TaxID=359342 RepID=A0AAJ0EBD4_9PEZI|nr:major facilitator superfamily domain-containing protein [Colletotrichum phormii]KAK1625486.1 major facilitator superfamily domain-containing protein [Colletotrichum phormii]